MPFGTTSNQILTGRHALQNLPGKARIKRHTFCCRLDSITACAYLGNILGLEYIYEAIGRPEIRILVQNAMLESAMALSQKYGMDLREIQMHITDLLGRFTNRALKDTCRRVGGDPARKLSPNDRMIGSSLLAMEQGITPVYICVGTAAGVYRYISETEEAKQSAQEAGKVLSCVSGMDKDHPLTGMILDYYGMLLAGKSLLEICQAADMKKGKTLGKVI